MQHNLIEKIKSSFENEKSILKTISGWIFTNFHHRDQLTDSLLDLPIDAQSTRRWVYIVRKSEEPIKILHNIEKNILDNLPGKSFFYSSQEELIKILRSFCKGKTFAILKDSNISVISTVDAGFIELLKNAKIKTTSAATLVQLTKGLLSENQIESQEKASRILYQTIFNTWEFIKNHYITKTPLYELDVINYILDEFKTHQIETDHPPIVAFGKNTGNPHYEVSKDNNALCKKGDVIQLDIWGKLNDNKSNAYADISWVGIYDTKVPINIENTFNTLVLARDCVLSFINNENQSKKITGAFLDKKVRTVLIKAGYIDEIKHRTGHGIDTECHGSGTNLDSIEFPDNRKLLSGCSFSVEPGLYFSDFGLRTEIDIIIKNNKGFISGQEYEAPNGITIPQSKILTC